MVSTATNYNADATVQAYDEYNNLVCTFASCDDIPDAEGCIYADTYAALREDFSAAACNEWGSACEAPVTAVEGCIDANADNYNAEATVQGKDQYGNSACIYSHHVKTSQHAGGCVYDSNCDFGADFVEGGFTCSENVENTQAYRCVAGCMDEYCRQLQCRCNGSRFRPVRKHRM